MLLSLIAAIDENYGIGKDNQLLCHLPADLNYFKQQTLGKPIIMGRKTFESIGRALPGRKNIVLSRSRTTDEAVCYVSSIEDALKACQGFDEAVIIGGAKLYEQTIDMVDRLYITQIHYHFDADTFFPRWDNDDYEQLSYSFNASDTKNHYDFSFITLEKKK